MEHTNELIATKHIEFKGVDPRNIIVVPGFNVRSDFGDLEELMNSIIENGLQVPLKAKKVTGEDKWELVDGERRLRAIMLAIEKGHPIKYVTVEPFKGNQEERLIAMAITGMDQKKFSKLEQAELVRRLVAAKYTVDDISKKLSKSVPTIYELIMLSQAPKEVKDQISEGMISERTVTQIMKENPDNEAAVVEKVATAVETVAKSTPEGQKPKKVTTKNVPGLKSKTTDEKLEELISYLKEKGISNEKTELLRTLVTNMKTLSVEKLALLF